MFTFLIAVMSLLAVLLCIIILLQAGKGGGLAAAFGGASSSTESFIGGRQAATVLTKLTWIGGGVFLFLSLVLAVLSSRGAGRPESILRRELEPGQGIPAAPTPVLESETTGTVPPPGAQESGGEEPGETRSGAGGEGSGGS